MLFYPAFRWWLGSLADAMIFQLGTCAAFNGVFWLLLGAVWRFSKSGRVSAGDLIEKTLDQEQDGLLWE